MLNASDVENPPISFKLQQLHAESQGGKELASQIQSPFTGVHKLMPILKSLKTYFWN